MNNTVKLIGGIIVLALIVWGITAFTNPAGAPVSETGPIKIGFIGPLSGDAAAYGADTISAAKIAVEEINASGGINGRSIEFISEDGKCSAKDGLSAAQKLIGIDKVKFIVSSSCSGELLGYTSFAEQNKVLVLNTLGSSPKITEAGDYIFRNDPSDVDGGKQLADLVMKNYKKVAVITENTEYAQGIRGVFVDTLKKNNATVTADEVFPPESFDFRSIVLKVKATNPEAIFLNPQTPANAARLAKQIRELGMDQQLYVAYMSGPEFSASGSHAEGTLVIDAPGLSTGKGSELLSKFKATYSREPGYPYFVGATYDAVYILSQAIGNVGEDTTKAKDYLYDLPSYQGTVGTYRFDANGDLVGINYVVRKVVGQKTVEVK